MNDRGTVDPVFRLVDGALRIPARDREAWVNASQLPEEAKREALRMLAVVSTHDADLDSCDGPTLGAQTLGGFEVIRPIGCGAGGIVYEAMQRLPRRLVALKVLRTPGDAGFARLTSEAESLARVRHPNIAAVLAAGVTDVGGWKAAWIAMELVTGASTAPERAAALARDRDSVAELLLGFAEAIAAAHAVGVLHRDIKPANLLVDENGIAKVVDFGIAVSVGDRVPAAGTPSYMAPECLAGAHASTCSDVWSLGAVASSMLDAAGIGRDDRLRSVTRMATSTDPGHRYADAGAMAEDVRRVMAGRTAACDPAGPVRRALMAAQRHPRIAAGFVVALLVLLATAGTLAWTRIGAELQGVQDAKRILSMHGELVETIDRIPPADRPKAAADMLARGRLGITGVVRDHEVVFLAIAGLLRLNEVERACDLANEALPVLRAQGGPGEEDLRWIRLTALACRARATHCDRDAVESTLAECESIGARSTGDDLVLASYLHAATVESKDEGLRELAMRADAHGNHDPSTAIWRTMLALVALSSDGCAPPDPPKAALLLAGVRSALRESTRDPIAILFTNLCVKGLGAAASEGDSARLRVLIPLARTSAAATGGATFPVWVEVSIGYDLLGLGLAQEAADTLDAVSVHPDFAASDETMLGFWVPQRVAAALMLPDPSASLHRMSTLLATHPKLGTGDRLLAEFVAAWCAGDVTKATELVCAWRSRQQKRPEGELRRQRILLGDRLAAFLAPKDAASAGGGRP